MKEQSDLVQFEDELSEDVGLELASWRVLVVDDDGEVHQATRYALEGVKLLERPLTLIHAYSAAEAEQLLRQMTDISIVLLDVVMEADDSGLCLINLIRDELSYKPLRIILRTGQPGSAPETTLVARYDIHDYMVKTDVSHERLVTSLTTAVRTYQQLANMALMEEQLVSVVRAVDRCLDLQTVEHFANFYVQQLIQIYRLSPLLVVFGMSDSPNMARILVTDEAHQSWLGLSLSQINAEQDGLDYIQEVMQSHHGLHPDCLLLSAGRNRLLVLMENDISNYPVLTESWRVFQSLMGVCFKRVC